MTDIVNETYAQEELTVRQYNTLVRLVSGNINDADDIQYMGVYHSEEDAIEAFFEYEYAGFSTLLNDEVISVNESAALDHMVYSHDAYVLTDWDQNDPHSYLVKIA